MHQYVDPVNLIASFFPRLRRDREEASIRGEGHFPRPLLVPAYSPQHRNDPALDCPASLARVPWQFLRVFCAVSSLPNLDKPARLVPVLLLNIAKDGGSQVQAEGPITARTAQRSISLALIRSRPGRCSGLRPPGVELRSLQSLGCSLVACFFQLEGQGKGEQHKFNSIPAASTVGLV